MAFMIPNYKYGTFISVTDEYGESHLIDEDYFEESMYFDCDIEE